METKSAAVMHGLGMAGGMHDALTGLWATSPDGVHLNGCRGRRGGSLARNAACGTKINFAKVPTEN